MMNKFNLIIASDADSYFVDWTETHLTGISRETSSGRERSYTQQHVLHSVARSSICK